MDGKAVCNIPFGTLSEVLNPSRIMVRGDEGPNITSSFQALHLTAIARLLEECSEGSDKTEQAVLCTP